MFELLRLLTITMCISYDFLSFLRFVSVLLQYYTAFDIALTIED